MSSEVVNQYREMEIVKTESSAVCHGCLSNDRVMSPVGEFSDIYYCLIGNMEHCLAYDTNNIPMCWECVALLKKFKMFQTQVRRAQNVLTQLKYGLVLSPESLSRLTATLKTDYDHKVKEEKEKKKRKSRTIINDVKTNHIEIEIKQEFAVTNDIQKTELFEDENKMMRNDADQTIFCPNDVENDNLMETAVDDDGFGDSDYIPDFKEEPVESEQKETKKKKRKKSINYKYYTENSTLVESDQIDFDNMQSYFTIVYFSEEEMEKNIFPKERHYSDHKRYKFSCNICKMGYRNGLDLDRHNDLHHRKPDSPFKCKFCKKTFDSLAALEGHWRTHTPIAKCNLCRIVLRPRGLKQHLKMAHTKQYACKHCEKMFGTVPAFEVHYRNAHLKFICDYCDKSYRSKSIIARHIKNKHIPAYCSECDRPFRNRLLYAQHCDLKHPELTKQKEIPSEDRFCVECNKQYSTLTQYRKHLKKSVKHVFQKNKPTACPECGKMFTRKLYMNYHYNLYHLKKTKYYCELCDKYFARPFGLRVHNTHVHQKVQRVKDKICDLCGRAFTNNRTMLNHRRTHTGERPHKCIYCTAEFIQKYAMQTHMRTQHKHFT